MILDERQHPCQVVVRLAQQRTRSRREDLARARTLRRRTTMVNWLGTTDDNGTLEAEVDGDLHST